MTRIKKVPGYMPVPARFKHLDTQRRNIDRDTAPFQVVNYQALLAGDLLQSAWRNKYMRYSPTAGIGMKSIRIPLDLTWPIGAEVRIMNVTTQRIAFVPAIGVTMNPPVALRLNAQWEQTIIKKVGPNEWDLYGDII
jgi:hypothetical protein